MFTGIIKSTSKVIDIHLEQSRLVIESQPDLPLSLGESIAINGTCLTLAEIDLQKQQWMFFVNKETFQLTNLSSLQIGDLVNIEPALKLNDRLSGHWVQGHIDGMGSLIDVQKNPEGNQIRVQLKPDMTRHCVSKGSITLDGVSLTINSIDRKQNSIEIMLIPFTWKHTRFHTLQSGDPMNVEVDILSKYVARHMEHLSQ